MHNVIYVATEHNSVYAFDADLPSAWTPLWKVNLGPSAPAPADKDLVPEVGITSTPVIDLATNTIYVVAETLETEAIVFRIHALDITTGAEKFGAPTLIQGSVPATSPDSVNGMLAFNAAMQWQRTGLLLLNGKVYVGFGSHQDTEPYHGWIFTYDATTLRQTAILCLSPDGDSAGVWQAGVGLTADAAGNIYFQTGHGDIIGADHGDSVVKVSTANGLSVVDSFTPSNQAQLSAYDVDFGSQGSLLIPGTSLLVAGGKDGKLFLLDTNNLGQFHGTNQVVQEWQATFSLLTTGFGGLFAGNVFYNSTLYAWGQSDVLKAFAFNGSTFNTTPSAGTIELPGGYSNEPAMSLSAKGTMPATGILWAAYSSTGPADGRPYPGILRAFDASDVTRELWNSDQNQARDYSGSWAKWSPPTVANGKVYLASFDNVLNVFGPIDPGSLTLTASPATVAPGSAITAAWSGIAAPTVTDWIGLYTPGAANTAYIDWVYVSCTTTPGNAAASGSCNVGVPSFVAPGTYQLRLLANDGFTSLATSNSFTVTGPVTLTNFSATPSLPLQTGDEVTWRATAVGGIGPLQYQFWLLEPGTGWRVLQEWSAQNVTTWTPATPGSYIVQVWGRSAGSSLPFEAWAGLGPFSVANGPLVVNAVSANHELPIVPGATATWRATTSGGDGTPLEFQFFRYSYQSLAWTMVQAYSASPEWTWTPTSLEVGGYHLQVWVRQQGSTVPWEAWKNSSLFYVDAY
jgi:hypothetical protein